MNHMKTVAQLLGVELDQDFTVVSPKTKNPVTLRITAEQGVIRKMDISGCWFIEPIWLDYLLRGEAQIVETGR